MNIEFDFMKEVILKYPELSWVYGFKVDLSIICKFGEQALSERISGLLRIFEAFLCHSVD